MEVQLMIVGLVHQIQDAMTQIAALLCVVLNRLVVQILGVLVVLKLQHFFADRQAMELVVILLVMNGEMKIQIGDNLMVDQQVIQVTMELLLGVNHMRDIKVI
ncbi:MAG: hypothetical protein ACK55I_45790, partial [bacterium]